MDINVMKKVEESFYKKRPDVRVGDTVKLHLKVKEGEKERTQIFEGVIIAIKGSGLSRNIVARKISYGVGVEKIVPLHSPILERIEIIKRGTVSKSKLYYLRGRVGKRALKTGETVNVYFTDEEDDVAVPVTGQAQIKVDEDIEEGEITDEAVSDSTEEADEEVTEEVEEKEKEEEEK